MILSANSFGLWILNDLPDGSQEMISSLLNFSAFSNIE